MTKMVLDLDYEFEFQLFGICSSVKDYQMALSLNKSLEINLARTDEDYSIFFQSQESLHSMYSFYCEDTHINYELLSNKGSAGHLISKQKQINYFLLVYDNILFSEDEICEQIRRISHVRLGFTIPIESVPERENLITV